MSDDDQSILLQSTADGITTLTLNRPMRRNALSNATIDALRDALRALRDDAQTRVVVLTGAGEKSFCAGGDLSDMGAQDGFLQMHHQRGAFADLLREMRRLPQPIVGRINGDALGGGFGLALACDVAIAADHARFGTPEIKVGLYPMMIMALIQRHVGPKAAMHMMLTAERFAATRALQLGCVNDVVPAADLDAAVDALAQRIASFSPAILRLGRKAYYESDDLNFDDALAMLHNELSIAALSEDAAEGVMAFLSKREPQWKGR